MTNIVDYYDAHGNLLGSVDTDQLGYIPAPGLGSRCGSRPRQAGSWMRGWIPAPYVVLNGRPVDFDAAASLMDPELRERLCEQFDGKQPGYYGKQTFLDMYAKLHAEKFGAEFVVN